MYDSRFNESSFTTEPISTNDVGSIARADFSPRVNSDVARRTNLNQPMILYYFIIDFLRNQRLNLCSISQSIAIIVTSLKDDLYFVFSCTVYSSINKPFL